MIELDAAVDTAKKELAHINGELRALHETYHERIAAENVRHEDRLRDLTEQFFYERQLLEKYRDAIASTIIDIENMKGPQPRIIVETPRPPESEGLS